MVFSQRQRLIGAAVVVLAIASGLGVVSAQSWMQFPSMHMHFPALHPSGSLLAKAHRQLYGNSFFDNLWDSMLEQQLSALQCQKHCSGRASRTLSHELAVDEHSEDSTGTGSGDFVATIALPHVNPEDIEVEIDGDSVTVTASRKPVPVPSSPLDKTCKCTEQQQPQPRRACYSSQEAYDAAVAASSKEQWSRRYSLPRHTPIESITATIEQSREQLYDNEDAVPVATLTLTIPKAQPPQAKKLTIAVRPMIDQPATPTQQPQLQPPTAAPAPAPTSTSAPPSAAPNSSGTSQPVEATGTAAATASAPASASASSASSTARADPDVINLD